MDAKGNRRIRARKEVVLARLGDAATLAECIPKCKSLTGTMADGFDFVISHKMGLFNATFRGRILFTELTPGTRYQLVVNGSGGLAGSVTVTATVEMEQMPKATLLAYTAQCDLRGWKSMLGGAKMETLFTEAIKRFFDRLTLRTEQGDAQIG